MTRGKSSNTSLRIGTSNFKKMLRLWSRRRYVPYIITSYSVTLKSLSKFIERYKSLNQPTNLERPLQSQSKRTLASIKKQRRQNVDDTESEAEGDNGEPIDAERPWLSEWNCYEKTHEAVPEGMGIVRWWGVCWFKFLNCRITDVSTFISAMHIVTRHGHPLLETTLPLWHRLSRANEPFLLRESPSASAAIDFKGTLLRLLKSTSASYITTLYFVKFSTWCMWSKSWKKS